MTTPVVQLSDLCVMDRRGLQQGDPTASQLPFIGVENVGAGTGTINFDTHSRIGTQKSTTFCFDERHVLYAKLRPYLNKVATPDFSGKCSTELIPLLPQDGVDREFIAHLLRRKETVEFVMASVTGSRMPRTDMKALMSMRVPLPSLDEQRQIVSILNRAVRIERMRAQAADRLREFIPALFIKLFGDPVENPMEWPVRPLEELVEEFRYGTSKKCYDAAGEHDIPVLRIPNIIHGSLDWQNIKYTSLEQRDLERLCLRTGDILFVRTNGNPDYIGRCAVFNADKRVAYASYLIRTRLNSNGTVIPQYVSNNLAMPSMRQVMLRLARTTAGNYNINIKSLGGVGIAIPPRSLQCKFLRTISAAQGIVSLAKVGAFTSLRLTASLTGRLLESAE